jgi:cystathionine beta-lyase
MTYNFDEIIDRSGTDCVKYDFRRKYFGKDDVIPMWVADMDFRTPDFIIRALKRRLYHEILGYTLRGDAFNEAIISWLKERHSWLVESNWITFTPGVVPGLSMAVRAFTNPGDKIVVQPPVYTPFFSVVEGNGRQLVYNKLTLRNGRYYMDLEDLRSKMDSRVKMLILSNPHNPGGMVWTRDELRQLCEFCLEHHILIVSDEIHCDLVFSPFRFTPVASLSDEIAKQVITFMSPSKTFNTAGLSTSFVIIPNESYRQAYSNVLETMHLFIGNLFGLKALEAAYRYGSEWLDQLLDYLKVNRDLVFRYFNENLPVLQVIQPEGTYMSWLDFRGLDMEDKELRKLLIDRAKVGLNDGIAFGAGGRGFMRLNFACPKAVLEEALNRVAEAVKL